MAGGGAAVATEDATAFFRRRFREAGSPARAAGEKAYLKSALRFYGAGVPAIRRAAADYARAHPELERRRLRAIAFALYATEWHELRSAAIALLGRRVDELDSRDLAWLIDLVDASDTWAHVDWLAAVIGEVLLAHPEGKRWLPAWARQPNLWVRRTALLALLPSLRQSGDDVPLFARLATPMLEEREFFIRKAIGWVLREVAKERPAEVYRFLRTNRARVSGLTLREGAKYLPAAKRRALDL